MSLQATAAYLKYLREQAGLSQAELARRTHTSSSQINRMEDAKGEIRSSLMARIILVLRASPEDVINLLANDKATEQTGVELAKIRHLQAGSNPKVSSPMHPEILAIASRMSEFQLGKWVAAGERILGE